MSTELLKKLFTILVYVFAGIGLFLVLGFFAVRFGLTNTSGIIDLQREAFVEKPQDLEAHYAPGTPWQNTEEWQVLSSALIKDETPLEKASQDSGVPARIIAANLVTEQLRLFFTERAFYKQFFAPLKILGSQTQFSWGVMGMKENTAIAVEEHLKDSTSPYYLGPEFEHLLDYTATSTDIKQARFVRMTDQHNHYWSYLYAGLFIKQIEAQWEKAGFPIAGNVAIISTLYNIGFERSQPNANPQVGGAQITINEVSKSFGGLSAEFYDSNLLVDLYPKK